MLGIRSNPRLRWVALGLAAAIAACSNAPRATPPATPSAPAPRAPPPPPSASPAASAAERAGDDGPPPEPPMGVRWSFQLAPAHGQPGVTQRLTLLESGDLSWESSRGGGDGDVDEELSPAKPTAPDVERCHGHLGPARHRALIDAARRAMAAGCAQSVARDRLGRPADDGTTTISVILGGQATTCEVGRSGGGYAALERLRLEIVAAICAHR